MSHFSLVRILGETAEIKLIKENISKKSRYQTGNATISKKDLPFNAYNT